MSEPRGQHHVPQTYLRGFAEGETIRVYVRPAEGETDFKQFDTNIKNVAKERDLYSLETESGRDRYIDENFEQIESLIPGLLDPVSKNHELSASQWDALKTLVAVQEMRAPGTIKSTASTVNDVLEMTRSLYRENRPDMTEEQIEERIQEEFPSDKASGAFVTDPRNIALEVTHHVIGAFASELKNFHGCIVTSDAQDFMTSDHPVVWFDSRQCPPHPFYGTNRQSKTIEVTYPLTRRKVLVLARLPMMQYALANEHSVTMINSRASYSASQVYAYPTSDEKERALQVADLLSGSGIFPLLALLVEDRDALHAALAESASFAGEPQGPGYEEPCPRPRPDGSPMCEHSASVHDAETGVCSECAAGAASFRPCARPIAK